VRRRSPNRSSSHADDIKPRVVIVGGGFGGFFAARKLQRRLKPGEADLTLVSDTDGMLYQPLLPDVTVGAIDPRVASVPLRHALGPIDFVRGRASRVDVQQRELTVHTLPGEVRISYDFLLLAPGSVSRAIDIPGLAVRAVGFKTTAQALYLSELVISRLETASTEEDHLCRQAATTFIVVGAGYAGVELTAQMARLTRNLLPNFPSLSASDIRWFLLNNTASIMPELGADLGDRALKVLRRRGVDVRLGTSVQAASADEVALTDGEVVRCTTVVWCAGVAAHPLVASTNLPLAQGRLVVTPMLNVPQHGEIFAIGDAAAVPDLTKSAAPAAVCPPTAQHAVRQGKAAAKNILAALRGRRQKPYRHRDLGLVVDLGGAQAVARPLHVPLSGWAAKLVTRAYHVYALPWARRRLAAVGDWSLSGGHPNDVGFGLLTLNQALASSSEHQRTVGDPSRPTPNAGTAPLA
jgi:NADH:quinone reductase (non-electrogenic)